MSTTTSSDSFHGQLAAVIEVLANTAVAEICKLVDDGYAVLRLEITQNQREIDGLRRKLLVAKFQTSRRNNHHLDRLSALRRSSNALHVTRGPAARCNPATKSSTQGTEGEEEGGGAGFPIILKVEGDDNTLKDIEPTVKHGSETNTRATANTTPRTLTVEPENHLHNVDQRFNTHHHSNGYVDNRESHHPSSERDNRFTNTTHHDDGNLFTSASEWAEAGAGIELWNNAGSLTTGNCSVDPPYNSGPHQEGRTGSNTDGREDSPGASEDWGGDVSRDTHPSNVAPPLAGNLDWEPDMVVVDSVPIKVEEDMSSEWSIIDRDGITRSAKQRLQKHGREEKLEAACSTPTLSTETLDRTTGLKSSLVDVNTSATSYGGLSSSSSSFSAMKAPRQVLHTQTNRGDNQSSSLNKIAASSAREFSCRFLSSIPPMALTAQPACDTGGQPLHCELCGKTVRNLRLHQRVHTGEKPYGCRHCSKRFSHQHQLKYHERVHTGEKPYACRHCSKRFSRRHQMQNHERVHTGEKPFRCPICGRCFVESSNMKRHLRIHT